MDRKKFIKHIKSGVRLRIDGVKIQTKEGVFTGKGRLHYEKGKFHFRVTLDQGPQFPEKPAGIYGRPDFGQMSGIIENHLPFRADFPPLPRKRTQSGIMQLRTTAGSIDLDATGWDELTHEQQAEMLEDLNDSQADLPTDAIAQGEHATSPLDAVECECHFSGFLKGMELIGFNREKDHQLTDSELIEKVSKRQNAISGALGHGFEFALIAKKEGLEFHLKSLSGFRSLGEKDDLRYLSSFFSAIGFVFGQHPWPFLLRFRRNGKLMLDRVRPYKTSASNSYAPFTDTQFYHSVVRNQPWSAREPIRQAFGYFVQKGSVPRWISNFLFHFREGSKGQIHPKVSATVLCPLLENLIRTIAKEFSLKISDGTFSMVKEKVVASLDATKSSVTEGPEKQAFDRFLSRCKSMEEWDVAQIFRAVTDHLQLPWDPRWKDILRLWKEHRNLSLHSGSHDPENDYRVELQVSSRIAGAINVLILKLMGYSGRVRWSAFDDDYGDI